MAFAGIAVGAFCVYLGGQGAKVNAARFPMEAQTIPGGALTGPAAAFAERARYVRQLIVANGADYPAGAEARLKAPVLIKDKPKIIIIFDDMGIDKAAFDAVMDLPGPVTVSFLPYAKNVQPLADRARARGDAVMLHLPMEPRGSADPGPYSLRSDMTGTELLTALSWNLNSFEGYVGVNNHMGSAFTADDAGMKTVLSILKKERLFFLDSLTTSQSVVTKTGRGMGATVFSRDVFLDPDLDRETVFKQLDLVERIARETGYAVAICHPRADTIAVLGPWLTSAPARGFELATVRTLAEVDAKLREKDTAKPAG